MKVVILAGGRGTRISEESIIRPKPMVDIGDNPIIWHIMKTYSCYGFNEFIICCGYKGHMIKEYFMDYYIHQSDITVDLQNNSMEIHKNEAEPWKITLVNTGLDTNTAGRVLKVRKYIGEEPFMLTYGDGVSNVDIQELLKFHYNNGKIATITAAKPAGRFGAINIEHNEVLSFREKSSEDEAWVNIGFAVFNPEIFKYLGDGSKMLEAEPYEQLAEDHEMAAYKHYGFWSPMDTMRDKIVLEGLWNNGQAPWKIWEDYK